VRILCDAIYAKSTDGTLVAWNRSAERLFGYDAAAALGRSAATLGLPDALRLPSGEWTASGSQVERRDSSFLRPDGAEVLVSVSESAIRDAEGGVVGMSVIARDVTAQRADEADLRVSEKNLRESERLLSLGSRMSRVGAWSVELPDLQLTLSAEARSIQDLPADLPLSVEQATDLYAPDSRSAISDAFASCVRDGTPFDLELQVKTLGGRLIWVRSLGEAERDAAGAIRRVHGAIQDISDRKQGQELTRQLAERLTTTLDSITDAFLTLDREWRFTFVNREAERLLGRSSGDLIGRDLWSEFPDALGSRFETEYRKAMATMKSVSFEQFFPPLGLWAGVDAYPSEQGLAISFRDVTERLRAEAALNASETRFRTMLQGVEAGVIVHAADSSITAYNDKAMELLGVSDEQMRERTAENPLWHRTRADDSMFSAEDLPYRRAQESRLPVRNVVVGLDHAGVGERRWLLVNANPVLTAGARSTRSSCRSWTSRPRFSPSARSATMPRSRPTSSTPWPRMWWCWTNAAPSSRSTRAGAGSPARTAPERTTSSATTTLPSARSACGRPTPPMREPAAAGIRMFSTASRRVCARIPVRLADREALVPHDRRAARQRAPRRGDLAPRPVRTHARGTGAASKARRSFALWPRHAAAGLDRDRRRPNVYCNRQWVDYTGLTLEESVGHGYYGPFHPDDRRAPRSTGCAPWRPRRRTPSRCDCAGPTGPTGGG
jgi:PAS domain S-box-containing protein